MRATRPAVQPCTVAPNSIAAKAIAMRTVFFMSIYPINARCHAIFVFLNGT